MTSMYLTVSLWLQFGRYPNTMIKENRDMVLLTEWAIILRIFTINLLSIVQIRNCPKMHQKFQSF